MRIGIDMRMAGTGEGIGRYAEELVKNLMRLDADNQYILIFMQGSASANEFVGKKDNFKVHYTKSKYYSWAEQLGFVKELSRLKLDIVHFPSFNAPIRYAGQFVVTIHDLIHHHYPGRKKIRTFHRLAYRLAMRNAIKVSEKIIAVSSATKSDILENYKINEKKVEIVYEGVADKFRQKVDPQTIEQVKAKYRIDKPYLLYVGAWRRYKNLVNLAWAFDILISGGFDLSLVMVGKLDPYYPKIRDQVLASKYSQRIIAPGFVSDEELIALYQGAEVFVLPSLMEGFGLIGVEAQAAGLPVAASNIPVLREVFADGAVYFDPNNPYDISGKIIEALNDHSLKARAFKNAERFDWHQAARQTLEIYKHAL